ncbi:SH3 domain-containing protein [Solimonas sp. K1W22B-7]|uniref:SH3 domain-containing protein n=1 Tax=Solimonas sp. K1W22B-7 TaxID=2303331 RepID=UPI000E335DBB|nr:SH3 domain-containing protein [Solimonas sp. K1W22B-7]AXQ27675.1 SH3 domain-containing protein [Solimonas sp. K1W22B-7]
MKRWIAVLLVACAGGAWAAESGVLAKASDLKQEPFVDAATVVQLPAAAPLEVLARQGAWMKVSSGGQTGWVRLLSVRLAAGQARAGESGLAKAANVALSGSSGTAVATGVRGLDKEQIANASPNPAEAAKLEGYAAVQDKARSFAKAGPLSEQNVPYLQ